MKCNQILDGGTFLHVLKQRESSVVIPFISLNSWPISMLLFHICNMQICTERSGEELKASNVRLGQALHWDSDTGSSIWQGTAVSMESPVVDLIKWNLWWMMSFSQCLPLVPPMHNGQSKICQQNILVDKEFVIQTSVCHLKWDGHAC